MSSNAPSSFGTTLSSGIQDVSAILSLLGTEQCERQAGSALDGGYLNAAITPVSIFGSLGPAKTAFGIMVACLPFGERMLQAVGLEPKGRSVAVIRRDGDCYLAETRLLQLLKQHHVQSANILVELPFHSRPIQSLFGSVDFQVLMASLLITCLGVTPYIQFFVHQHTTIAVIFPLCRIIGGQLCVFFSRALLQYRICMILKQRILFMRITAFFSNDTQCYIAWDEDRASEDCLSSLNNFLESEGAKEENTHFISRLAQVLDLPAYPAESSLAQVSRRLKLYLHGPWSSLTKVMILLGFLMTLVGYVGCFNVVQNSPAPSATYIWVSVEVVLALIRLLIWLWNPSWASSDGIKIRLDPQETSLHTTLGTDEHPARMFKFVSERRFWEALKEYSGSANLDVLNRTRIRGFTHYYCWIPGGTEILSVILQGEHTVMCTMNNNRELKFYHAEINSDSGDALRMESLVDTHELLGPSSDFKRKVYEHCNFILATKEYDSDSIRTSWALLEYSV